MCQHWGGPICWRELQVNLGGQQDACRSMEHLFYIYIFISIYWGRHFEHIWILGCVPHNIYSNYGLANDIWTSMLYTWFFFCVVIWCVRLSSRIKCFILNRNTILSLSMRFVLFGRSIVALLYPSHRVSGCVHLFLAFTNFPLRSSCSPGWR